MNIAKRIENLRDLMKREKIDTYIITKFDPHQSEYSAPYWNGVRFISGFTGSAGVVVITNEKAGLWTDGRYYIQATRQLEGSGVDLHRAAEPTTKDFLTFARDETPEDGLIAFDGRTISMSQGKSLEAKTKYKRIQLRANLDLVNELWDDREPLSQNAVYDHAVKFSGKSRSEKINDLRNKMKEEGTDVYVLSSNDDIAWLFNLRGNDLPNIPFFAAFAVVDFENAAVFIHKEKSADVKNILEQEGIILKDYGDIYHYLKDINKEKSVMVNPLKTNYSMYKQMEGLTITVRTPDITTEFKAVKNSVELENLEKTNIRDGVAMVRFIKWLKDNVSTTKITEYEITDKLIEFRKKGENFVSPSFDTIAGYMANAAMMHYSAKEEDCAVIEPKGMLLVDCGGDYYDGSTDITRTIAVGEVSAEMKKDFTLVLKSHISLAKAIFLYGATGSNLDVIARMPMWVNGLDYKCGTGHGLGFFLNVHEGPQNFSQTPNTAKMEIGMIITNEPGIYRQDQYGIRTENTMCVKPHNETEFGQFLAFDIISYCPIDRKGIDVALLSDEERSWLNDYHQTVFAKLSPYLDNEEVEFLREETKKI